MIANRRERSGGAGRQLREAFRAAQRRRERFERIEPSADWRQRTGTRHTHCDCRFAPLCRR
jgi:hypothetical protein